MTDTVSTIKIMYYFWLSSFWLIPSFTTSCVDNEEAAPVFTYVKKRYLNRPVVWCTRIVAF